jgi:hypothetical protein
VEGSCEHGNEPSGSLKLLGISSIAAQLAASQEGLHSLHSVETMGHRIASLGPAKLSHLPPPPLSH